MKNLVTGGAGFLGTNLIKSLLKKGQNVVCLDNFSTSNKNNIYDFIDNSNFQLLEQDVIKPIDLEIDRIWHLACPASPFSYLKKPIETSEIIFNGTLNLLKLAQKQSASFLFASSSEIYGESNFQPQKENQIGNLNPISRRSCYREGKRMAESLCYDFYRVFNIDIKIARIFNTYGPFMQEKDGRVISNFIFQAFNDQSITVNGDGQQTRSFCFVDDLILGLIKLMESDYHEPVNLGNNDEIKILELAHIIRDKINPNICITYKPIEEDDSKRRNPDILLAQKVLQWSPKIKLEDGINLTIDYYKKSKEK